MTILYELGRNLYVNLTNRCPCRCAFCIRQKSKGVGTGDDLWLEHEPDFGEIVRAFEEKELSSYDAVVFCGYGEPLERIDLVVAVCKYLKEKDPNCKIRINTNGLSDLIHGFPTACLLKDLVDAVSISLNAPDAAAYNRLCHPTFGEKAFDAMLRFAQDCKRLLPEAVLSVVDCIPAEELNACRAVAQEVGLALRVRTYAE